MGYLEAIELAGVNDYYLYHTTGTYKVWNILRKNTLYLSLSESNESEKKIPSKHLYFISLARTTASGYIADIAPGFRQINEAGLFVFDRRILERFRGVVIKPVDYFGKSDFNGRQMFRSKEAEERLFSNNVSITNISKAIVELRLTVKNTGFYNNKWTREAFYEAKKRKIPVKLFTPANYQGYLLGKENPKDRKLAYAELMKEKSSDKLGDSGGHSRRNGIVRKKLNYSDFIQELNVLLTRNKLSQLPKELRNKLYYLVHGYEARPFESYYSADIHNMKLGSLIDKDRFDRVLKRAKAKSVKDLFDKLSVKWTKIYDEGE